MQTLTPACVSLNLLACWRAGCGRKQLDLLAAASASSARSKTECPRRHEQHTPSHPPVQLVLILACVAVIFPVFYLQESYTHGG